MERKYYSGSPGRISILICSSDGKPPFWLRTSIEQEIHSSSDVSSEKSITWKIVTLFILRIVIIVLIFPIQVSLKHNSLDWGIRTSYYYESIWTEIGTL
jgi:hypothetical protein